VCDIETIELGQQRFVFMSNKSPKNIKKEKHRKKAAEKQAQTRGGMRIAVISLLLTVVSLVGLIALRPQMSMSPLEPLRTSQPFSVPFRFQNTGLLSFGVDSVYLYLHRLEKGGLDIREGIARMKGWDQPFVLQAGEASSIVAEVANFVPDEGDMVIVIDYRKFGFSSRRYFRFRGAAGDNWQWLQQPSAEIEADAGRAVDDYHRRKAETNQLVEQIKRNATPTQGH
jgi:hypothetical protein